MLRETGPSVSQTPVAVEPVVFYVNSSNPVGALTMNQIESVYTGKVSNWKQLGGADLPIPIVGSETMVGGSLFVREIVLNSEEFDTTMQGFSKPKEMAELVAKTPGAIGFGPLMQESGIWPLPVRRGMNFPGMLPNSENLRNGQYPLSQHLYWIVRQPMSISAQKLCSWLFPAKVNSLWAACDTTL